MPACAYRDCLCLASLRAWKPAFCSCKQNVDRTSAINCRDENVSVRGQGFIVFSAVLNVLISFFFFLQRRYVVGAKEKSRFSESGRQENSHRENSASHVHSTPFVSPKAKSQVL